MIYLVCFAISLLFMYFANKTQNRKLFVAFSVGSILFPVLLAGLRDYSVGIDTMNYLTYPRYWGGASSADSLGTYLKDYMDLGIGEPLFALLCGAVAQLAGNYSVFLILVHTLIITGVYIGVYRFRKEVNPVAVMALFYLVFYNHSLNIMRQYMAMAIVFAVLADIMQGKYLRYCICVAIAMLLHTSAALGFVVLFVYWFVCGDWNWGIGKVKCLGQKAKSLICKKVSACEEKPEKAPKCAVAYTLWDGFKTKILWRQVVLFAALGLLVLVFNPLCHLLIHIGLLSKRYLWFLNMQETGHATMVTLFLLLEMAAVIVLYKKLKKTNRLFDFFFACSGAYLILYQLSAFIVYGKRVAAYFSLANLITIAMLPRAFDNKKHRLFAYLAVFGVVLFYWLYSYALRNASGTFPYTFVFA